MDIFEEFTEILRNSNIKGKPLKQATYGVKRTVHKLVNCAKLPSDIAEKYAEFGEEETLLYLAESYRDHFFHPFHTFLLGFLLLKKLKKNVPPQESPLPLDEEFLKKWLVTSLWHDITYSAEKGHKWLEGYIKKRLDFDIEASQEWGGVFCREENIVALNDLASKFGGGNKKRELLFRIWLNKQLVKHKDHAILSSIRLIRDYDEKKQWQATIEKDVIYECALSIAIHNFPKAIFGDKEDMKAKKLPEKESQAIRIGPLDINDFKLAYLLSYCDTAQEWGRPSIRCPSNHIKFQGIEVNVPETKVHIKLGFDVKEYMIIQKGYEGISEPTETTSWEALLKNWRDKKVAALKESWKCSHLWNFYIHQTSINMKDGEATQDYITHTKR